MTTCPLIEIKYMQIPSKETPRHFTVPFTKPNIEQKMLTVLGKGEAVLLETSVIL